MYIQIFKYAMCDCDYDIVDLEFKLFECDD